VFCAALFRFAFLITSRRLPILFSHAPGHRASAPAILKPNGLPSAGWQDTYLSHHSKNKTGISRVNAALSETAKTFHFHPNSAILRRDYDEYRSFARAT
jgi:hypothetical protein